MKSCIWKTCTWTFYYLNFLIFKAAKEMIEMQKAFVEVNHLYRHGMYSPSLTCLVVQTNSNYRIVPTKLVFSSILDCLWSNHVIVVVVFFFYFSPLNLRWILRWTLCESHCLISIFIDHCLISIFIDLLEFSEAKPTSFSHVDMCVLVVMFA